MKKRGLLMRFIDVGLIILFGFIVISDIKSEAQIQLPITTTPTPPELATVVVEIDYGGRLALEDLRAHRRYPPIEDLDELGARLRRLSARYHRNMVVIIDDDNTFWKHVVGVKDVCERDSIRWSWNYY